MRSKKMIAALLAATLCATPMVYANASTYVNVIEERTGEIAIIEQQGWLESAYVTWKPVEGASGYKVYYKSVSESDSKYTQLDNELIRKYPNYYRADAIGLPEGDYTMKIVPVFEEDEVTMQAITSQINVKAHTREGFAFSKESPMGTGSGGYNDDGSIPADAQIIYITAETANTVQLDVIVDAKGKVTTATGLVNILAARQKGHDQRPLIIRVVGTVKASDINGLNSNGYIQIKGSYNTTLEGVGEDATVSGWGILVRESKNVEIRNLGIMLFPDDGISLDTKNQNIWVHNNDIFYGTAGGDADQAKGDGAADIKAYSNYITMSYNHFWDAGKSSLCGMNDSEEFFVTYHHNWYDHSDSRHPRIRKGTIHIYNNYFDGNSKYGVGMTTGGSAFVESNDFRNCKYPMLISLQGTDIADGNVGTFSKEPGGIIKAYNNKIEGASRLVYQTEDSVHFDAYLAESRNEQISDSYQSVSGGHIYNNFDTADTMYAYTPDAPDKVREVVTNYAGRVNGGDLKWTFTPEDDTDYSVNAGLMAAIRNYQSELVSIGGINPTQPEEPENPDIENPGVTEGGVVHNFTESGKDSDFFSITGNLSTSKGSVNYNGMLLTQCLKLESSTSIQFTITKPAILTLVLDEGFAGKIDINGNKETAAKGMFVKELEAGTHTIKKGDTANLFYMSLEMIDDEEHENEGQQIVGFEKLSDITINVGESYNLPKQVVAYYEDETSEALDVTWNDNQVDNSEVGVYEVTGVVANTDLQPMINIVVEKASDEVMGTVLTGASEVAEGEIIEVSLGVNNVQKPVYAGDITLNYDEDKLTLSEVTVLGETMLAGQQEAEGVVRILTGNETGILESASLLKLKFMAKDVEQDLLTNIKISSAVFGIVEEGNGQSIKGQLADKAVTIKDTPIVLPGDVEDINKDDVIDVADLAMVAYYYRAATGSENWEEAKKADINNDGVVGIEDLIAVARKILGN